MEDHTKQGVFSWNEMLAHDVEGAKEFYTKLFGWTTEDVTAQDGSTYTHFKVGDEPVGGLMSMPPQARQRGVPSYWGSYVSVDDIDATARRVEELGGKILVPPMEAAGHKICVFQDPQGAVLTADQFSG